MSGDDNMPEHNPPEIWRIIASFPDYAISDQGRVKRIVSCNASRAGAILIPQPNSKRYLRVVLYATKKPSHVFVHRLVLEAFAGKPFDFMEANHKDGDLTNNRLSNLEWVTPQENAFHSFDLLGRKCYGKPRLTNAQTSEIRMLYNNGSTQTELAKKYGVSQTTIWKVVHRYRRDAFEQPNKHS
jgi:hypothetical protein